MELNLRPMGMPELLDRSITLYRKNFLLFVAIESVITMPVVLIQVVSTLLLGPTSFLTGSLGSATTGLAVYYALSVGLVILSLLGGIIQMAALSLAVSERYHERPTSLKAAYGRALRRWDSLLVVSIVLGLVNGVVMLLLFGPLFALALLGPSITSSGAGLATSLLALFGCLAFVPAVVVLAFLDTRWAFVIPSIMIENLRAFQGLGRSWRLVRGYFWRVLGTGILLILFVYALEIVPVWLFQIAAVWIAAMLNSASLVSVLSGAIGAVIGILVSPIQFTVLVLLYYDIRIRKEGYDLVLRVEAMNAAPAPVRLEQGA
ncbi:MAG: hypothetical protein WCF84_06910 [Anaerolineae bacterium]